MLGVAWPYIQNEFTLSLDAVNVLLLVQTISYTLASFFIGRIMARFGSGMSLVGGKLIMSLCFFGIAMSSTWIMLIAFGLIARFGSSIIDADLNLYVTAYHFKKRVMQMYPQQKRETNKLLGYPPDARLLIINADDFGMCHSTNVAIFRSLKEGVVCSTTLMVPCNWSPQAMQMLAEDPTILFGVHLTAICDGVNYRWRPLTGRDKVPSLVDETGHFYTFTRMDEFLAQVRLDELEVEFRAQIETVLAADLKPTHLDWHSLRIAKKPELYDVMFKLAREYGLALRVRERPLIEKAQSYGLPANDYDFLDSYSIDTIGKLDEYIRLLRNLPEGLSEWAVHPGLEDAELLGIDPDDAPIRQADLKCMLAASIRDVIQQEGITLISYKLLQEVWQRMS